ncbi:MAG: hypothetical protein RIS34_1965 [Pseudomonadota bacterium]|jgi:DNA polymerase
MSMTPSTGLNLDARQRAMLQAMHIKVWQPDSPADDGLATPTALVALPAPAAPLPRVPVSLPAVPSSTPPAAAQAGLSPRPDGIDQMDWPTLAQAVSGCRACGLCESRKNTVFGVGQLPVAPATSPQVDWLIVGEAPGENEDLAGEPFVGQAGKLLDNMLRAIGLDRHNKVYIANVLKCRPPVNRNPEPHEVAQCTPYLRRQIELLQPKIILAMGRFAMNALLDASVPEVHKLPLGKLRGQIHHCQSAGRAVPVIVTYHPAYLLRNLPEKAKAWADLCLALDVMRRAP